MLIYFIINIYRIKYTELFDSIMMKIKTKFYNKETLFILHFIIYIFILLFILHLYFYITTNIIHEKKVCFFRLILLILFIFYITNICY